MRESWSGSEEPTHTLEHLPAKSFSSSSWPRRTAPLKVEHLGSPRSRTLPFLVLKLTHSFTDCSVLHAKRGPTAQCFMRNWSSVYARRNCCPSGSAALATGRSSQLPQGEAPRFGVPKPSHVGRRPPTSAPWSVADTNVVPTYSKITWRRLLCVGAH